MASQSSGMVGSSTQRSAPAALASRLILVLVGLIVARTTFTIVMKDSLVDAYAAEGYVADGAPKYVPIAVISLVLFGGLLAVCAIFVAKGARWARITAIVMSVLTVLGSLLVFVQANTTPFVLINLVVAVAAVAVIVALLRPGVVAR